MDKPWLDGEEFTGAETERQDCVDNVIHNAICELAGQDVDWDIEDIANVRDALEGIIVDKLKLKTEQEFYPFREIEPEPSGEPEPKVLTVTDEQLVTAVKKAIEDLDADELAMFAGDCLGGLCWDNGDGTYSFETTENYWGAFDPERE